MTKKYSEKQFFEMSKILLVLIKFEYFICLLFFWNNKYFTGRNIYIII